MANSQTAAIIGDLIKGMGQGGAGMTMEGDAMKEFMMMRLSNMIKMAGKSFPAGLKRTLNEQLTKIKKD